MPDYDEDQFRESASSGFILPRTVTDADMFRGLLRGILAAAGNEGLTKMEITDTLNANTNAKIYGSRVGAWLDAEEKAGRATLRPDDTWIAVEGDADA